MYNNKQNEWSEVMSRTIDHWTIKVTWSDGEEEFLDDIPNSNTIENYLDEYQNTYTDQLSDLEVKKLDKRLNQIEQEQKKSWGLHRISGGFVKAEFNDVDEEKIYITLKSGVQSDCENRVTTEDLSLWRNNLEWTD